MSAPPRLEFAKEGISVEGGLLWLDARTPKPLGLITHAHGDHVGRHATILCTPETAALVRRRSGAGARYLVLRYGERLAVGDLAVTLLPAGHILGSAMARVEGPGGSLLYTGDVRPDGGLTCPPAAPLPSDHLVIESTFGRPDFVFPPAERLRAELVEFARAALDAGETPVFLAYALGKAQEVMAALAAARVPVAAHGAVWNLCAVYRTFGIAFPGARPLSGTKRRGSAVVVPPRFLGATEVRALAPLRAVAVTGWGRLALIPGVERVIPLSDHADFPGLLRVVEAVRPERVFTLHGYAAELAAELRKRGYAAEAVGGHAGPAEGAPPPGAFGPKAVEGD